MAERLSWDCLCWALRLSSKSEWNLRWVVFDNADLPGKLVLVSLVVAGSGFGFVGEWTLSSWFLTQEPCSRHHERASMCCPSGDMIVILKCVSVNMIADKTHP